MIFKTGPVAQIPVAESHGKPLRQSEIHRYIGLGFDGYAVPHVRFVPPLLYRLDGSLAKKQGAIHEFQVADATVFVNPGLQNYGALQTGFQSLLWIAGRDFLQQQSPRQIFGQAYRFHLAE
jgi:hypothetical protein